MKRILRRLCLRVLVPILVLTSSAFATPQLPGGLGGVFKKKPKDQPAQQQPSDADKKKQEDEKKKADEKKQLFSDDSATAKQKKDTTAMGFSGLNPDGTVENAMLNSSASSEDEAAAITLSQSSVAPGDLKQFIADGNLKSKGGQ